MSVIGRRTIESEPLDLFDNRRRIDIARNGYRAVGEIDIYRGHTVDSADGALYRGFAMVTLHSPDYEAGCAGIRHRCLVVVLMFM